MNASRNGENSAQRTPLSEVGRDELNLAEFPLTVLTDKIPKSLRTIAFTDQVWDQATGETARRTVTISGSDVHGLPGPLDMDVLICLIQITKLANNFTSPEVLFNRGELLRMLCLPDSGNQYRRIDESLRRWLGVTLYHDGSWWDKNSQEWSTNEGWHILEHLVIVDRGLTRRRRAKGQLDPTLSSFTWNKIFFRSCQAENIKRLDLGLYFSLGRAISKRMFRFLDKRFYHRNDWTFDLKEFAFEHIGISRNYDTGEIKSKLRPAIEELEAIGFLKVMSRQERYAKLGCGKWTVRFVRPREQAVQGGTRSLAASELPAAGDDLGRDLVTRGVTPAVAAELVASYTAEQIRARIEIFDWLSARQARRVSRNPGGFLAESIRKDYVAPKGFESVAERQRRQTTELQQNRRTEEANRRTRIVERSRWEVEEARVARHLATLTPAEREALEAEALARATPFFLRQLRRAQGNPASEARYRKLIVDMFVSETLGPEA